MLWNNKLQNANKEKISLCLWVSFNFNWFIISGNYIFKLSWLPQLCLLLCQGNEGYTLRACLSTNQAVDDLFSHMLAPTFKRKGTTERDSTGSYLQLLQRQNELMLLIFKKWQEIQFSTLIYLKLLGCTVFAHKIFFPQLVMLLSHHLSLILMILPQALKRANPIYNKNPWGKFCWFMFSYHFLPLLLKWYLMCSYYIFN